MTQWNQLDLGGLRLAMKVIGMEYETDVDRMIQQTDAHGLPTHVTGLRIRTAHGTVFLVDDKDGKERYNVITVDRNGHREQDGKAHKMNAAVKAIVMFLGEQEPRDDSGKRIRSDLPAAPPAAFRAFRFAALAFWVIAMAAGYFWMTGQG